MNDEQAQQFQKFAKPYNPAETESRIYAQWEESGYFNPDNLPTTAGTDENTGEKNGERSEPYTIVMPPANANGNLHVGHALGTTLQDILIRFKRMQGYKALYIPGADHAGFETQVVYEKKLEKEGRSRFGMDPKELYKEILEFTLSNKSNMEQQIRDLGASCDWSREKFTLDPDVVAEVQRTFLKMYEDELVYRGKRTINWCPKHQTSLSDIETDNVEEKAPFYYFKYGPFEIGTVRPETKFGDKYVVMHPEDKRYAEYEHGQKLTVEWINGPIEATIIKDSAVDMEFGTGVMTITPWHSQIDFEIAKRHGLEMEQIIDWYGKLLPIAGEFAGMKIAEARPKIVEKLASKGLVTRIDENYQHVVKRCYKCNSMIEPQVKEQWFVKMAPLARLALDAADQGKVKFIPAHEEKTFRHWMENVLDWNISRQIVWGIPIPAWICDCGGYAVTGGAEAPMCETCNKPMRADTDTFDTWFSSGQWPLMTTGYSADNSASKDFAAYYPTAVMETGRDIIFFWVARMIMFGLYLTQKTPFHTVYLHGLVNDAQGKKMSKSKGNVISPLDLTSKYGTDALRMALVVGNTPGTDLAMREDKVKGYKHFANKIWNVSRFVLENTTVSAPASHRGETLMNIKVSPRYRTAEHDQALFDEFLSLARDVTLDLEEYRIYLAAEKIYHYAWHRFADEILEESKQILSNGNDAEKKSRMQLLRTILIELLKLLHPFMPFITEEIWQSIPETTDLLMIARWPIIEVRP
jgi:valyl-tRNA synthetase